MNKSVVITEETSEESAGRWFSGSAVIIGNGIFTAVAITVIAVVIIAVTVIVVAVVVIAVISVISGIAVIVIVIAVIIAVIVIVIVIVITVVTVIIVVIIIVVPGFFSFFPCSFKLLLGLGLDFGNICLELFHYFIDIFTG